MMLAIAMANRNNADTNVPTTPPKLLKASKRPCNSVVATAIATVSATTIVEWPSEKNRPTPTGPAAFLHQFAGHVVDRRDVIRVESVPEAKTIGERSRAEEDRIIVEGGNRPQPRGGVEDEQEGIDRNHSASDALLLVIEEID